MKKVTPEEQFELFKGCVIVVMDKRIYVPNVGALKRNEFNARFEFNLYKHQPGARPVKSAWHALIFNMYYRWPRAMCVTRRGDLPVGALINPHVTAFDTSYEFVNIGAGDER